MGYYRWTGGEETMAIRWKEIINAFTKPFGLEIIESSTNL